MQCRLSRIACHRQCGVPVDTVFANAQAVLNRCATGRNDERSGQRRWKFRVAPPRNFPKRCRQVTEDANQSRADGEPTSVGRFVETVHQSVEIECPSRPAWRKLEMITHGGTCSNRLSCRLSVKPPSSVITRLHMREA
jgi:hypothetical protein